MRDFICTLAVVIALLAMLVILYDLLVLSTAPYQCRNIGYDGIVVENHIVYCTDESDNRLRLTNTVVLPW